jgi:hypothetical protein
VRFSIKNVGYHISIKQWAGVVFSFSLIQIARPAYVKTTTGSSGLFLRALLEQIYKEPQEPAA